MKKIVFILSVVVLAGCYNDNKEDLYLVSSTGGNTCDTSNVTFKSTILPIFTQSCATSGCHDALTKSNGYDLSNYDGAKASSARLVGAVKHLSGYWAMPKGGNKLEDCKIAQIEKWVNMGSPNN